jgi:hypothetical protein
MKWTVAIATLCLLGLAPREAAAADTYAAIAFSKASGAEGHGNRFHSRSGAEERALQECGRGCSIVAWARNQCLAFAVGRGNGYGYSMSTNEDGVVRGALSECRKQTNGCEFKSIVCSAY